MRNGNGRLTVFGFHLPDPFLDSYHQETLTCHDIIDKIHMTTENHKGFLQKVLYSHLEHIRQLV